MNTDTNVLGAADYLMFIVMLLISSTIGIYFRFTGGKQKTTEEYLLAGKSMTVLPVAFSLMASFKSAIAILGLPTETYKYGVSLAYMNIGWAVGFVVVAYVFLPVYFNIGVSTAYEYLEKRFGKLTQIICSIAFLIHMILYLAVNLYAPALVLSSVMNMPLSLSLLSIGVVCTFYCTLGGIKAVLWTDVFQAILMYACVLTITIKGCIDNDGIRNVFKIASEGGRLAAPSFSADPTLRFTMWNVLLQGFIFALIHTGANQVQLQRLLTIENISKSRKALFVSIPMNIVFHVLNCFVGLILYASFADCDPLTSPENPISSDDQLLPYYVMLKYTGYPGLPGIFVCGLFSASLSTVSSLLNSLTAVTMQDLIGLFCRRRQTSEKAAALMAKVLTFVYGIICIFIAFAVSAFGNIIQSAYTFAGMLGGPVLGVFFLGMTTTRTNEKGAIIGLVLSISLISWISFGSAANTSPQKPLPMSTEGCFPLNSSINHSFDNSLFEISSHFVPASVEEINTSVNDKTVSLGIEELSEKNVFILYNLSYMWFATFGFTISTVVGYFSSILISSVTRQTKEIPPEFLSPVVRWCWNRKLRKAMKPAENFKITRL